MMSLTASDLESCHFSSEELAPADRIPFYREVLGRMLMRAELEPVGEEFFRQASFYRLPGLGISYADGSPVRIHRTREMVEGGHEFFLMIGLEGTYSVCQLGRRVVVPAGGATLISAADPMRSERTRSRGLAIAMPRAVLAPMVSNMDAALMSAIPSRIEPLRLLAGYIDLLKSDPALMATRELRRLTIDHLHDLVVLTLGATRDVAEIAVGRGLRAARLRAIKADIVQNLAGDVTTAALSARHHLSPRYIRSLFEGENTSLSQFVLGQRLTHMHRLLTDLRYADRTISDLALAAGFGDISTFNREFRRRFGMTPSDVRNGL
jgi:AraC-like DNA-binding protein